MTLDCLGLWPTSGKSLVSADGHFVVASRGWALNTLSVFTHGKEEMRKTLKYRLVALLAAMSAAAGSMAVATPAHAYGSSSGYWRWVRIDTDTCNDVEGQWMGSGTWSSSNCYAGGQSGTTTFLKDSNAYALKGEYVVGSKTVSSFEFHPYGEVFRVCDLTNDGDGVYYRLGDRSNNRYHWHAVVSPPGTSKAVECRAVNYGFAEGTYIAIEAYDNASMSDPIHWGEFSGARA